MLIRLRGCAGWSAPLLFAYGINRFSSWHITGWNIRTFHVCKVHIENFILGGNCSVLIILMFKILTDRISLSTKQHYTRFYFLPCSHFFTSFIWAWFLCYLIYAKSEWFACIRRRLSALSDGVDITKFNAEMSLCTTKPTKWPVLPVKTLISLGNRRVSSVFVVPMKKPWVLSYPLCAQQRLRSDRAHAQADLSLRWAHMPFCWFCCVAA